MKVDRQFDVEDGDIELVGPQYNVRIVAPEYEGDKILIQMIENGEVVEDGEFDADLFTNWVLEFYNKYY